MAVGFDFVPKQRLSGPQFRPGGPGSEFCTEAISSKLHAQHLHLYNPL